MNMVSICSVGKWVGLKCKQVPNTCVCACVRVRAHVCVYTTHSDDSTVDIVIFLLIQTVKQ